MQTVEQKLLSNLPALAAMYQMQQQAFFQAGLQAGGIMSYPYQQGNPQVVTPSAGKSLMEQESVCEQTKDSRKKKCLSRKRMSFLITRLVCNFFEKELILSWKRDILTV